MTSSQQASETTRPSEHARALVFCLLDRAAHQALTIFSDTAFSVRFHDHPEV
jgi:hypothetical protein